MNEQELFAKLLDIIKDIKDEEIVVDLNTALIEAEIMDSLEIINYLTQIEETFEVNISMDELIEQKLGIIANMIKHIQSKKA